MWAYATCGMSQPKDLRPMELHMFSPWASPEIEELLVVTADFHRNHIALGVGDSVNFGRPWLRGSKCEHGLVSLPYLYGPALENLRKQENGLEALEQSFERAAFNYLDPQRESTIQ